MYTCLGLKQILNSRDAFEVVFIYDDKLLYVINIHEDNFYGKDNVSGFVIERKDTIEKQMEIFKDQLLEKSNAVFNLSKERIDYLINEFLRVTIPKWINGEYNGGPTTVITEDNEDKPNDCISNEQYLKLFSETSTFECSL